VSMSKQRSEITFRAKLGSMPIELNNAAGKV